MVREKTFPLQRKCLAVTFREIMLLSKLFDTLHCNLCDGSLIFHTSVGGPHVFVFCFNYFFPFQKLFPTNAALTSAVFIVYIKQHCMLSAGLVLQKCPVVIITV